MTESLMTARQFAQRLGVAKGTVDRWCHTGKLVPIRTPGGHKRFSMLHLAEAIAARTRRRPGQSAHEGATDPTTGGRES